MSVQKVGQILESGSTGHLKWWVIESISEAGMARLCELKASDEIGVMERTSRSMRRKIHPDGGIYCRLNGGMREPFSSLIIKP